MELLQQRTVKKIKCPVEYPSRHAVGRMCNLLPKTIYGHGSRHAQPPLTITQQIDRRDDSGEASREPCSLSLESRLPRFLQ